MYALHTNLYTFHFNWRSIFSRFKILYKYTAVQFICSGTSTQQQQTSYIIYIAQHNLNKYESIFK